MQRKNGRLPRCARWICFPGHPPMAVASMSHNFTRSSILCIKVFDTLRGCSCCFESKRRCPPMRPPTVRGVRPPGVRHPILCGHCSSRSVAHVWRNQDTSHVCHVNLTAIAPCLLTAHSSIDIQAVHRPTAAVYNSLYLRPCQITSGIGQAVLVLQAGTLTSAKHAGKGQYLTAAAGTKRRHVG
jgi:hypothetical protein